MHRPEALYKLLFSKSLWEMTILFTFTFNDFREFNRNDKNQGIFYFSNLWCDNKNNQPSCFVEACKLHSKINIFGALLFTIQYLYWNIIKFSIKYQFIMRWKAYPFISLFGQLFTKSVWYMKTVCNITIFYCPSS